MEDIVRHNAQLHLALEKGLTGSQIEIHIGRLPPLRQVMSADVVTIELQSGILGHTEIVDPTNGTGSTVLTDAALACSTEIMEGEVAIGSELPPRSKLGGYLQFQSLTPSVTGIDNAIQRHPHIIGSTDIIHHTLPATHISRGGYLCIAKGLTPREFQRMDVLRLQIGVADNARMVVLIGNVRL